MKKILYVVYSLDIGGLERVVVDLVNSLNPDVYQPYICCTANAGALAADLKHPNSLFVLGNKGRINYRSCKKIYDLLNELDIDIVHSHNTPGLLYSFIPAKLCKVPIIHTNHGYVYTEKEHILVDIVEKSMSRNVSRYVCVSKELNHEMIKKYKIREKKMCIIYNGIRIPGDSDYIEDKKGILIGSVGNLRAIKNYKLLIESFDRIVRQYPDCRLELIGEGDEYDNLVELRNKLSLQDKVYFRGQVRDVHKYLKRFDIFVLPSLSEGISMSVLEALSLRKICVLSDVGGNPEIIEHGKNGFLFKSNNKTDLIEKLSYVIDGFDRQEIDEIKERALQTVTERFSLPAMIRGYCDLYDAIIAR